MAASPATLGGREDLRTPLEDQRRAALQLPGARVVAIPDTGHVTLFSDVTGCAVRSAAAFLDGRAVGPCRRRRRFPALALPVPRSIDDLDGAGDRRRRTLAAAALTFLDAARQAVRTAILSGGSRLRAGGLRGGTVSVAGRGLQLRSYEYVTGVRLTGTTSGRRGSVRVGGDAARAACFAGKANADPAAVEHTGSAGCARPSACPSLRLGDPAPR